MKIKKYHKQLTAICILLLLFMIIILINFDYIPSRTKRKTSSVISCDIALITYGTMDNSYMEIIKEGIESASSALGKSYKTFAVSDYGNSYDDAIKAAAGSASLVILPDATFEEAVYSAQTHYVNTYFILIDGIPHNADRSDSTINYNVIPMSYDVADAGFLAGFAAVYDDNNILCFVCDESNQKSLHYCYGFLQGADYAASLDGKTDVSVSIVYESENGGFIENISDETQLIAAASDDSVSKILKDNRTKTIPLINCTNYDVDNENIVATATKNIKPTINDTILDFFNNQVKGGTILRFDTANNGVSLVFDEDSFRKFDENAYKSIYKSLSIQEISIISDTTVSPEDLGLTNITINIMDTIN